MGYCHFTYVKAAVTVALGHVLRFMTCGPGDEFTIFVHGLVSDLGICVAVVVRLADIGRIARRRFPATVLLHLGRAQRAADCVEANRKDSTRFLMFAAEMDTRSEDSEDARFVVMRFFLEVMQGSQSVEVVITGPYSVAFNITYFCSWCGDGYDEGR